MKTPKWVLITHPQSRETVAAYFLHTREVGDYNRVTFSRSQGRCTKNITRHQVYFIPREGAEFMPDLQRGMQFWSVKEGFLFGAMVALKSLGEIIMVTK